MDEPQIRAIQISTSALVTTKRHECAKTSNVSESTAITILRLLTAKPPPRWKANKRAKVTDEQTRLLAVLSDEWLEQGVPGGHLLAERLPGPITDRRCVELGFEIWLGICSLHRLVLFLMPEPVFGEIALAGDEQLAFRLCDCPLRVVGVVRRRLVR